MPKIKDNWIHARCTQKQKNKIKKVAAMYGLSVSEWVIKTALDHVPEYKPKESKRSANI